MRVRLLSLLTGLAVLGLAMAAAAADWSHYANARYGYEIDVPPGFSEIVEADNGDGGTSISPQGNAELKAWGSLITERDFAAEISWRIGQDRADGWDVSYQRVADGFASWSGRLGARIMYQRAILFCGDRSAYFRIEYDQSDTEAFNPIIQRLVKSLRADGDCG